MSCCLPSSDQFTQVSLVFKKTSPYFTSHMPKKGKAVVLLSTMHHDKAVDFDQDRKPEINLYYNKTKGGMDLLDQHVHAYMSKHQTLRWFLCYFFKLVDIAGVASFVIFTLQNPKSHKKKKHKKRLFLEEMSEQLVNPQVRCTLDIWFFIFL